MISPPSPCTYASRRSATLSIFINTHTRNVLQDRFFCVENSVLSESARQACPKYTIIDHTPPPPSTSRSIRVGHSPGSYTITTPVFLKESGDPTSGSPWIHWRKSRIEGVSTGYQGKQDPAVPHFVPPDRENIPAPACNSPSNRFDRDAILRYHLESG